MKNNCEHHLSLLLLIIGKKLVFGNFELIKNQINMKLCDKIFKVSYEFKNNKLQLSIF